MKKELIKYELPQNPDDDVVRNWEPLKKTIDASFKYEHTNVFYKAFSYFLYWLCLLILIPINYICFGTKVKGKKNLKKIKKGAVIVCNHCHIMDSTMLLTVGVFPFKAYMLADKSSFQIPVVRRLVGPLGAVPIADTLDGKRKCFAYIDKLLQKGKKIVIYPEGSMWPYYTELRPFKDGAFKFSSKNNVPVVPMCMTFRKPKGLYRIYKRKPLVTITIMKPIYPTSNLNDFETRDYFKEKSFDAIKEHLENNKIK